MVLRLQVCLVIFKLMKDQHEQYHAWEEAEELSGRGTTCGLGDTGKGEEWDALVLPGLVASINIVLQAGSMPWKLEEITEHCFQRCGAQRGGNAWNNFLLKKIKCVKLSQTL